MTTMNAFGTYLTMAIIVGLSGLISGVGPMNLSFTGDAAFVRDQPGDVFAERSTSMDTAWSDTTDETGNRVVLRVEPCANNKVSYSQDGNHNNLKVTVRGAGNTVSVQQSGTENEIEIDQQPQSDVVHPQDAQHQRSVDQTAGTDNAASSKAGGTYSATDRDQTAATNNPESATDTAALVNPNIQQQSNCNEAKEQQ